MKECQPLPKPGRWKILLGLFVSFLLPWGAVAQYQSHNISPPFKTTLENQVSETSAPIMDIAVTGRVTDQNGKPLPGVTVVVEGTSTGTVTDLAGEYKLEVAEGNSLVFSFVGYRSETRLVGNQSIINVILREDLTALQEVVVTALGIERDAKSLGYATSVVASDEMTVNRTPNFMNS